MLPGQGGTFDVPPMKKLDVPQSGSQASTTASRNRFGQYNRTRAMPTQPRTASQVAARATFTDASQAWRGLTLFVRQAWNAYAAMTPKLDSLGQTIFQTGHQAFVGLYAVYVSAGLSVPPEIPIQAPPVSPIITVGEFSAEAIPITVDPGLIADQIALVYASPPTSKGVTFNGDYRFMKAVVGNVVPVTDIDIIVPWEVKFGAPQLNQQIFIRLFMTSALSGKGAPVDVAGSVA